MSGGRPRPVPDEQSEGYWKAAAEHVLALARCARCARFTHPPDVVCPHCGTTEPAYAFTPVEGSGSIRSWTVMRHSFLPGFDGDVPFVLVDVELSACPDVRMVGRLLDGVGAPGLKLGAPVHLAFEDIEPGVSVPAFAVAERA